MGGASLLWKVAFVSILFVPLAPSQDRIFNYTYQSIVLAPHQQEIEVWNTIRWGRTDFYRSLDQRIEFEIGLAANLQVAFYMNSTSTSMQARPDGTSAGGYELKSGQEFSFSNEWKYRLSDPVADPLGLALYGEYTIAPSAIEFEPRLICDKNFGRSIIAFNAAGEFEINQGIDSNGGSSTEHETEIQFSLAAGTRVAEGWHVGLELFNRNGLEDGALLYSALFAGPTLSYAAERFWVNVSFLPQIAALKGASGGGLVLDEAERYQSRILFSYAF